MYEIFFSNIIFSYTITEVLSSTLYLFQDWMICGYDCYEDHKQSKTVGAFVASTNPSFTSYYSTVQAHEGGSKIAPKFQTNLLEALKYSTNHYLKNHCITN